MAGRSLFLTLALCLGLWAVPTVASAAILTPSAEPARVTADSTLPVSIFLDSQGADINVVEVTLRYPSQLLEVVDLIDGRSFLSLWAERPRHDPAAGTVKLAGGIPNGAVVHNGEVLTVLFRGRRHGEARITIDDQASGVYLDDGLGTKTDLTSRSLTVTIGPGNSLAPKVSSPTHPDEDRWYQSRDVTLTWIAYEKALYSHQLSRDPGAEPDDVPEDKPGQVYLPALADGVWYLTLKERFSGDPAWGPVARRRLMIDGTPPAGLSIELVREKSTGEWLLVFNAIDAASGIERYELKLLKPRSRWFPFFPRGEWQTVSNPVRLEAEPSFGTAIVRVVDGAGNERTAALTSPGLRDLQKRFFLMMGLLVLLLGLTEALLAINGRRSLTRRSP